MTAAVLLNHEDYTKLGYSDVPADDFEKFEPKAERAVAAATNYYYRDHDIDNDPYVKRAEAYREAICEQINFAYATGMSTSYDGDSYKAVSIGRLSLTPATDTRATTVINGICKEAYALLARYGLLYRGVGSYDS